MRVNLDDFLAEYEEEKKRQAEAQAREPYLREDLLNKEWLENSTFEPPATSRLNEEQLNATPGLELRAVKETFGDKVKRLAEHFAVSLGEGTMLAPAVERVMRVSEQKAIEEGRMRPEYAQFQEEGWLAPPEPTTPGEKITQLAGELTGMMAPIGGLYSGIGKPLATRIVGEGTGLAARAGRHFLPGAIAGGIYGTAEGLVEEGTAKGAATKALEEAALFGGGDIALRGAGKLLGSLGRKVGERIYNRGLGQLDDILPLEVNPKVEPVSRELFETPVEITEGINQLDGTLPVKPRPGAIDDDLAAVLDERLKTFNERFTSEPTAAARQQDLKQTMWPSRTVTEEQLAAMRPKPRDIVPGEPAPPEIKPPEISQRKVGTNAYQEVTPKTPEQALGKYADSILDKTGERPVVALSEAVTPAEIKTANTARSLGVEVRYFESNSKFGDTEFVDPDLPGVVFIRKGTNVDPRWVAGHGFVHTLRVNHPELYQGLYSALAEGITAEQRHSYLQMLADNPKYREAMVRNPERLVEEILADEGGNLFANKRFWEYLSDEKPGLFERIITTVKAFFDRLMGREGMLGNFDNTLSPNQVVKFREEFAKIIDEIRGKQYNKTSGLDMLGEPRGHRSRVAQSSTPTDKSSLSLPEAMEKDALDVQFATRIDREEVLPNGFKRAFYTINASTGRGIQGVLEYAKRSFKNFGSDIHDEASLKAIQQQIESIPKEVRDKVLDAKPGTNKLENQPLLSLSRGCFRNGAVLQAIENGVLPQALKKWLTSCHGACYKNYDTAAINGASIVSNLKSQAIKYINDPVGFAAQKAEYDTLKSIARDMGVDLTDSVILAKRSPIFDRIKKRFRESLLEEEQSRYYNTLAEKGFWKPWTTQENMAPVVATPEEAANFVKNMKNKTWDMLTKGDHKFIRSNQQGDWLLEVASGTFESFMDAMVERGFRESGKKISVVTTGWYVDVPMETLKRIAQKYGDLITVQATSGFDFPIGEAILRLKGFDKLRKAGLNPVMRVITDEFGMGGANLNHPEAVKETLKYIVDNKLTPFDVLDTPLHIDAPGFKILDPSPKNIAALTKRVQDLWDIPTEEAADLAMRIIKRNQVFYREVGERKIGHEEVGLTYERLQELGVPDDIIQGLKDLGFRGRKANGREQVFPAVCCTTGKCTSCSAQCMNRFNRATDSGKIFTPKASEIVKELTPSDAGSILNSARNNQQRTTKIPEKMEYLGRGQRARSFPVSVAESQMASPEVKAGVAAEIKPDGRGAYVRENLHDLDTQARQMVQTEPAAAERMIYNDTEPGGLKTAVGIRLIEHHQKLGDHQRAVDISLHLAQRLTKAGQETSAARIMGALDPQGVLVFAQRQIKKINDNRLLPKWTKEIGLTAQDAENLQKLAKAVKDAPDEASRIEASQILQDAMNSFKPAGIGKKIATTQTIAQLYNPRTHIRNILGNEIFYYMERASKYVATPIDWARSKLTGSDRTVTIATGANGFFRDFFDGYRYFKEGLKKGATAGFKGVNPDGIQTQYDLGHGLAFKSKGWEKPLSWLERTMGAALKGMDYAAYNRAKKQLIGEMAVLKCLNTHGKYDKKLVENYAKTFDANVEELAHQYGKYCTYQDDNLISKGLQKVKRGLNLGQDFGLGDIVLKYPRTPGALVARGLEYSPAGVLRAAYQLARPYLTNAKPNPREVTLALSRSIIGAGGATVMAWILTDLGILTGRASKDKDLNALQRQVGEGSFRVNLSALRRFVMSGFDKAAAKTKVNDLTVSYDWAQPIAMSISMGASAAQDVREKAGFKKAAGNASSVVAGSLESALNTVAEQPVLQGLTRLFQGYSLGDNVTQTLKSIPSSFTPTLANQIRQLADNQARTTYDPDWLKEAGNIAEAKIPGLASKLPPAYDTFGNPRKTHEEMGPVADIINVLLNPAITSHYNPSPEAQRAVDLAELTGDLRHIPRVPPKYIVVDGQRIDLTPEEYSEYQRLLGQLTAANYDVGSGTPEEQIDALAKMLTQANAVAKQVILAGRGINIGGDTKSKKKTYKKSFL